LPQEDYPLRAVRAAWALQQSVQEVHANLPQQYHLNFGIGVGVGEAVVGNIGTPQMMNFTIIGDAVNKVKRLQENAKGGQILIDEETYHLIQKHIRVKSVGQIHLKGQKKPEPVYEVLGLNEFSELPTFMDEFADWGSLTAYTPKV
jgi:adenylate cyclase